jgi:hypothetical protein
LIILIMLGEVYKSRCSFLCSFLHSLVTPSFFGPNILLSTLFSNTLSLCSFLNVRDQVLHPYRTTGKIIDLYILIDELLERKSCGSGLKIRDYGRRDPSCWPRATLHPQTLALTLPTSCDRSVGIVARGHSLQFLLSFKHILILTSFMGTPNSMRILYNTSLLTES